MTEPHSWESSDQGGPEETRDSRTTRPDGAPPHSIRGELEEPGELGELGEPGEPGKHPDPREREEPRGKSAADPARWKHSAARIFRSKTGHPRPAGWQRRRS